MTLLASMLTSIGLWLAYVVGGVVVAFGAFLYLTPLFKRGQEVIVSPSSEDEEIVDDDNPPLPPLEEKKPLQEDVYRPEPEESKAPRLEFSPKKETEPEQPIKEEEDDSPLSHFNFTPAGRMDLPRRSGRYSNEQPKKDEDSSKVVAVDPLAPKPLPNPDPSIYRSNPIKVSGLREAFFDPDGFDMTSTAAPIEKTPVPEKPVEPRKEDFNAKSISSPRIAYAPEAEEEEEKPLDFTPAFAKKQDDTPSFSLAKEEEEQELEDEEPIEEETPIEEEAPLQEEVFAAPQESEPAPVRPNPAPRVIERPATHEQPFVAPLISDEPEVSSIEIEEESAPEPKEEPKKPYVFPSSDLLKVYDDATNREAMEEECIAKMANINQTLSDLKAGAQVVSYVIGPSTTRFDVQMDPHVPVSSLNKCIKDIGIRLGGVPTRFVEIVPGHSTSALEVVNAEKRTVPFKEVFDGLPQGAKYNMVIPFGENIEGKIVAADLSKFPHMLLAGTTGSGKSIFMHGIIMSLLMRNSPDDLKIVLVDPKRVEMSKYKDLPHLLCPIIKEPSEAKVCLKKLCDEMEKRYGMLEENGVSEIREYNELMAEQGKKAMPFVVCFIDEYADLVESAKEVGEYVLKLAAKSRAAGIHLVVATQRPDVKVITGTIKANLPVRVALSVKSTVDSMTILGQGGAEELAGHGDMLVDCSLIQKREFVRAQGCLVDNHEIRRVTDFIREQRPADYDKDFLDLSDPDEGGESGGYDPNMPAAPALSPAELKNASQEEKYQMIKSVIMTREFTSISQIQRDFSVGFPRAGKIFSRLQAEGIVAKTGDAPNSSHGSKVLVHEAPADNSVSSSVLQPTQNDISPDFGD